MSNHEALTQEADELYEALKPEDRERMMFRWSYRGNHGVERLEVILKENVLPRLKRLEGIIWGIVVAGILGYFISRIFA